MSGLDIAKLRRLHEAASAGEWRVEESGLWPVTNHWLGIYSDTGTCQVAKLEGWGDEATATGNLIAAMRNALPDLLSAAERATALEAEVTELRQRLLTAAGDDLCRLTQEEIKAMTAGEVPIPPKSEFLASCERFHEQVAAKAGVNHDCLTLAQLVAENEKLRGRVEHNARAAEAWEAVQEMGIDIEAWHDKNNWIAYYVGESLVDSNPIDAVLALAAKLERTNDEVGTP